VRRLRYSIERLTEEEDGIALILALVIVMVLTISATTVITLMVSTQNTSSNERQGARAFTSGEAGLDLAPAHQHRPDQRMRAFDLPASPLGERERPLEAHFSAPTSRRYARGRSSRPKIDMPATNRLAPAS